MHLGHLISIFDLVLYPHQKVGRRQIKLAGRFLLTSKASLSILVREGEEGEPRGIIAG